jgi:hypothetical protein
MPKNLEISGIISNFSHWNKARLGLYALDPGANFWKIGERKAAFVRNVCVRKEGDVGDGVAADKEIIFGEVFFHDLERGPTAVAPGGQHG